MTHKYTLNGMNCSGCESTVRERLLKIDHITDVIISKETNEAEITMSKHVEIETLQEALGGFRVNIKFHYQILTQK